MSRDINHNQERFLFQTSFARFYARFSFIVGFGDFVFNESDPMDGKPRTSLMY